MQACVRVSALPRNLLSIGLGLALCTGSVGARTPVADMPRAQAGGGAAALPSQFARSMPALRTTVASSPRLPAVQMVTTCDDDGPGSLRATIGSAVSGDVIDLTQLTCSTITLASTLSTSLDDLTLQGPGASQLAIARDVASSDYFRVMTHLGLGTLTLADLTIRDGSLYFPMSHGGCIYAINSLLLTNTVVENCTVYATNSAGYGGYGGAIFVGQTLTLENSTISDATLIGGRVFGGGAFVAGDLNMTRSAIVSNEVNMTGAQHYGAFGAGAAVAGSAIIVDSLVSGNRALSGYVGYGNVGGIDLFGRASGATISNSTISGNIANGKIGAVYSNTPLAISNSTIAFNKSGVAGAAPYFAAGVNIHATTATLQSTIIANNRIGTAELDLTGPDASVSGTDNLIMASLISPPGTLTADPLLQPLADNGGATLTHALPANSPAIDVGNNLQGLAFDQRGEGFARVVGAQADIGAFESDSDHIFADGFDAHLR